MTVTTEEREAFRKRAQKVRNRLVAIPDLSDDQRDACGLAYEVLRLLDALEQAQHAMNAVDYQNPVHIIGFAAAMAPAWEWRDGMRHLRPHGTSGLDCAVPDLSSAATRGEILQLVRDTYNNSLVGVYPIRVKNDTEPWWNVGVPYGILIGTGPTEAEALMRALWAAPGEVEHLERIVLRGKNGLEEIAVADIQDVRSAGWNGQDSDFYAVLVLGAKENARHVELAEYYRFVKGKWLIAWCCRADRAKVLLSVEGFVEGACLAGRDFFPRRAR